MTTTLLFSRDAAGYNTYGVVSSDEKYSTTLSANVEQTIEVPDDAEKFLAVISTSTGSNVWVAINNTATIPSGSFAATKSDLNPPALKVLPGQTMNFITADTTAYVNVKFYSGIT